MSWFFSPVLTGLTSATIFTIIRTAVMRRHNARSLVFWVLPPAVTVATFINIFFVFTKGAAKSMGNNWPVSKAAWVSAVAGIGAGVLAAAIIPVLRWRVGKRHEAAEAIAKAEAEGKR
jgi:sodium-dependent phosphate transporter